MPDELIPFLDFDQALLAIGKEESELSSMELQQIELLVVQVESYIVGYCGNDPRLLPDLYPDCRMIALAATRIFMSWYTEMINHTTGISEQSFDLVKVKFADSAGTDKLAMQILGRYALSIS